MNAKDVPHQGSFRSSLYLFIILMIIWLVLTNSLKTEELLSGLIISLLLTHFLSANYRELGLPRLRLKRAANFIAYVFVLLSEIIKANFDVAYRVLHPKMPIRPGIIIIKTSLKQDIAKVILANSITLTPGTFTLDIKDDALLIHWINVKSEEEGEAAKRISERFEKYLKVVFE
ncbi:MAG: Na+/H+ antiporter subunit E [Candidatus Marinimicrobia bacterium]|nr:Na+/H+ antiporter subunit E [Candidatus Neomarinimicrobiota bacterium]